MSRSVSSRRIFCWCVVVAAFWSVFPPAFAWSKLPVLDVGLALNRTEVSVSCRGGLRVRQGVDGPVVHRAGPDEVLSFARRSDEVLGPRGRSATVWHVEALEGANLRFDAHEYRGFFVVAPAVKGPGLNLVNHVEIELYLNGVLKAEMPPSFPSDALKAQAVVARTFAMRHKDSFRHLGFGLKATEQSQVYRGISGEDRRTTVAVMATRGIVLTHEGRPIEASYHACCGGRTENNEDVWQGSPRPFSRSVRCSWCQDSPHFEWKADFSYDEIERALASHGWNLGRIREIELSYSDSGRVRYVVITTSAGRQVYVPGNKFRIIVDRRTLKSLKFVFKDDPVGELLAMAPDVVPDDFESNEAIQAVINGYLRQHVTERRRLRVTGRGFGHGVGLCQWGARGLAERKTSFGAILRQYYLLTELRKIY